MRESLKLVILWQKLCMMKMFDESMGIHILHYDYDFMNVMHETDQN